MLSTPPLEPSSSPTTRSRPHTRTPARVKRFLKDQAVICMPLIDGSGMGNQAAVMRLIHDLLFYNAALTFQIYASNEAPLAKFLKLMDPDVSGRITIYTDNEPVNNTFDPPPIFKALDDLIN